MYTSASRGRVNRRWLIGGAVVLVVIGLGIVRYFSPTWTSSQFINAFFAGQTQTAQGLVCADSGLQQTINASNSVQNLFGVHPDASHLTYQVASESATTASVKVTGTTTVLGVATQSNGTINLKASGLGWCVESLGNG
jgi:hypothetical protein